MKIGLFGISGVYNFGCEAIVRGAYSYFSKSFPNSHVIYYSFCPDYDRKRLSDLDIEIVPVFFDVSLVKRAVNKILRIIHSKKQFLMLDKKMFASLDLFVSIGGDLYTIPKNERKKKKYEYHNVLVDICDYLYRKKIRFVILGASIGPFGEYKYAVDYYKDNLRKASAIFCREENSINYLNTIGVHNTIFLPDPAFLVFDDKKFEYDKNGYIGINLSYLSLFENIDSDKREEKLYALKEFVELIYKRLKKEIMFIPHVVYGSNEKDNDFLFMKRIYDQIQTDVKRHVFFANFDNGFLGIKKEIRKCGLVISARMHCCVNSICENIPTVFISYSQKSEGMCNFVYTNSECLINIESLSASSINKIESIYSERDRLNSYLVNRNIDIKRMFENEGECTLGSYSKCLLTN